MERLWRFLIVAGCALAPLASICQGQSSQPEPYLITTVAGSATIDVRDGGPATDGLLSSPAGLAFDGAGNLYIADEFHHRVRKVDPTGRITTIAGTGVAGFSGDAGAATQAELSSPGGVTADEAGNIYIADTGNGRIRRIDPSGTIITIARTTTEWIALDAAGNIYFSSGDLVRRMDRSGAISTVAGGGLKDGASADGGPATEARLRPVRGLTLDDDGNLYIAEPGGERIRRVTPDGIIHTIAGTGERGFSGDGGLATEAMLDRPRTVAVDDDGNVYIADTLNRRVRKVTPDGIIRTIVGSGELDFSGDGGPAIEARISTPVSLTLDSLGQVYIGGSAFGRVRRINTQGIIHTVAGRNHLLGDGGPATAATFWGPRSVALDRQGNLYISDAGNHAVRKVDASGIIVTIAGVGDSGFSGDGGPATEAKLAGPGGIALDDAGNVYFADVGNHRIRRIDPSGTIRTVAGSGEPGFNGDGGDALLAAFNFPVDVAIDSMGNLYVADSFNGRVRQIDAAGQISTIAGNGQAAFNGDGGPATEAQLCSPQGLAVDSSDNLYVADRCSHRVRRINQFGRIHTLAGTGEIGSDGDGGRASQAQLASPSGVTIDDDGNIYIAERDGRIRKITFPPPGNALLTVAGFRDGIIQTIAGGGSFPGEGRLGTEIQLVETLGLAVDRFGKVYFAGEQFFSDNRVFLLTPIPFQLAPRFRFPVP